MAGNNTMVELSIESPILRPGLKMKATCSLAYAVDTADRLMETAREINLAIPLGEED